MANDERNHANFWTNFLTSPDRLVLIPSRILRGNITEEIFLEEMEAFKQRYRQLGGVDYIMNLDRNTFWADVMYLYSENMEEDEIIKPFLFKWYQFKMDFFRSQGIPLDIEVSVISDMYSDAVTHKPLIKYYIEDCGIDVNLPGFYDKSRNAFWSVVMKYGDWSEEDIEAELFYLISHGATPKVSEMDNYRANLPDAYVNHIIQIIETYASEMIKEPAV